MKTDAAGVRELKFLISFDSVHTYMVWGCDLIIDFSEKIFGKGQKLGSVGQISYGLCTLSYQIISCYA